MTVYVQTESGSAEVFKTIYVCERCGRVAEIDECPAHGLASRRHAAEPEAIVTDDGSLIVERRTFQVGIYKAGEWVDWAVA